MLNKKVDGVILLDRANRLFYSHIDTSFGIIILTDDKKVFITDSRYALYANTNLKDWIVDIVESAQAYNRVAYYCDEFGIKTVGYEDNTILKQTYGTLVSTISNCRLIPFSDEIKQERAIKDASAIAKIQQAQKISELALSKTISMIKHGVSEKEVCAKLVYEMLSNGADKESFDTVVAFGANSASPHHHTSDKKYEKGEIILIDMGCKYQGYCSDMTRSFVPNMTSVNPQIVEIHHIVKNAQQNAIKHIKAGMTCTEVDAICREYIKANGYSDYFKHSTGHGVGLDVHEYPRIVFGQDDVLQEGMVVTIEPGIYLEGIGGVRIEDMVVVQSGECINLTKFNKELLQK